MYCANVTTFATTPTDTAFFYSYSGDTFNGADGQSELLGAGRRLRSFIQFVSQATGFQNVSVQESGTGKDVANLTATAIARSPRRPISSTLVGGGVAVVTVDTFYNNNGTYVAVSARIDATGTSTDTANLYDSAGTNSLVVSTNTAMLTTPVNTVSVKQFGFVNAYADSGTTDTVTESDVDIALSIVGNWTSV